MATDETAKSFESGVRKMMKNNARTINEIIDFKATVSDNPLRDAFNAKVTVHSDAGGMPVMDKDAISLIESQYDICRDQQVNETRMAYIHVPFCETRCLYCLFYQNPLKPGAGRHYVDLLLKELELWSDRKAQSEGLVHAVYFGGGTPTALDAEDIERMVEGVKKYLPLANDCEMTLEGRFHHFDQHKMEAAFKAGVNRISLGAQSFDAKVRQTMRRVDGPDAMIRTIEELASFNQASIVCDLIYGFPYQTMSIWENDLKIASELPLDGVDCYQLNVFEKSPLGKFIANGKLPAGADKAERGEMFARSVSYLTDAQWRRLSNNHWARTFRERNLYNRFGKSACDCLAFGCGAGGKLNGHSFMMHRKLLDWETLISQGIKPVAFATRPGPHWSLLRTISSEMELGRVNLKQIGQRFALDVDSLSADVFKQWESAGLVRKVGDWHVQTLAGQFWHVTMSQLLMNVLASRLNGRLI